MMKTISPAILLLGLVFTPAVSADAKPVHHPHRAMMTQFANERPPLTVNRRSFLDPGPEVPVGSMSNYVVANTIFNRTPDQINNRSYFGNELLPAPLEVPGRSSPLLEWYAPRFD
jgi:hypothetical protein